MVEHDNTVARVMAEVAAMDEADRALIERLKTTVVYPRFLGLDDSGDYVWELENGKWVWGIDPDDAICKPRKLDPVDYCQKYGQPAPLDT